MKGKILIHYALLKFLALSVTNILLVNGLLIISDNLSIEPAGIVFRQLASGSVKATGLR